MRERTAAFRGGPKPRDEARRDKDGTWWLPEPNPDGTIRYKLHVPPHLPPTARPRHDGYWYWETTNPETGVISWRRASAEPPKGPTTIQQLDAWLNDFRWDEEALSFDKADKWLGRFPIWRDEQKE